MALAETSPLLSHEGLTEKPALVDLDSLVLDPEMQFRAGTDHRVVAQYKRAMEAGEEFPPVLIVRLNGVLFLVDGWHRVAAHRALFRESLDARIVDVATREEARWLAATANLRHGLPLKARAKREVFKAYVRAGRYRHNDRKRRRIKSYREMAEDLPGFSYSALRRWMKSDFPPIYKALARGEDEIRGTKGGLPDPRSTAANFAEEVRDALLYARNNIPGIAEPEDRFRLLEIAEEIIERLKGAGAERPDF